MAVQASTRKLLWILIGSGVVFAAAGGLLLTRLMYFQEQGHFEKMSEDHTIAFMRRYAAVRQENYKSLITRNKLGEFEVQLGRMRVAVQRLFDPGKTNCRLKNLSWGSLVLSGLFFLSGFGVWAGIGWAKPVAFWGSLSAGALYLGYGLYRILDAYRSAQVALAQHYAVISVANPALPSGNVKFEALWVVILNAFGSPFIFLQFLAFLFIIWLLGKLR